ncbi:hypothetical protein GCM10010172_32120 [Paractinoplanes ferrugineus]|uniref:Uncharacterized protein n=1 Tax=Paractinoplanes ferrugineus TaxID=113564 RepID=A0A919J3G8_9ACTN|nr:hypothetical protein Afe05nite_59360 [Actinoplanes ferrugineus]
MQAAHGADGTGGTRRRQALLAQGGEVGGDVGGADGGEVVGGQERGVTVEVASVGLEGVARQAPLDRQVVEVGVDDSLNAQRSTSARGRCDIPWASATGP